MVETKVTDLTALTTTTADDVVMVVNDPAGVATSRQMTIPNLFGASGPVPSDLVLGVGQKIGIGNTPVRTLDVVGVQPQVRLRNVTTDATLKRGWVSVGHYTNAEEDVALLLLNADVSSNVLFWGGGTGSLNAATEHRFYAAPTHTTVSGTQMARISTAGMRLENGIGGAPSDLLHVESNVNTALLIEDATGDIGIGTASPAVRLDIVGLDKAVLRIRNVTTDATEKKGSIQFGHYTNAEEDIQGMHCLSNASTTILRLGGGLTSLNTVEDIRSYTATNTITQVGTEMTRLTSAGFRIEKAVGGAPSGLFHVEAGPGAALVVDDTSGDVSISPRILNAAGSGAAPAYSFTADADCGMWLNGSTVNLASASITWLRLNNTGVVVGPQAVVPTGTATLAINQSNATGAVPNLLLDQKDLSEPFIKIVGESTTDATQSLVDAADLTTPGTITGWFQLDVQDDQGTGPITDGVYFVPFYTAPTA